MIARMQNQLGKTILQRVTGNKAGECSFCYCEMKGGDKVIQLACWPDHQFHEECYNNFVTAFENNGTPLLCPFCRTPIEKDKVVKKLLAEAAPAATMKTEDAFGLDKKPELIQAPSDM